MANILSLALGRSAKRDILYALCHATAWWPTTAKTTALGRRGGREGVPTIFYDDNSLVALTMGSNIQKQSGGSYRMALPNRGPGCFSLSLSKNEEGSNLSKYMYV